MLNPDDVAKVVKDRTEAVAAFVSAVPGKAWFERGPDAPDSPIYAVFRLKPGGCEVFSGPAYRQPWVVELAVYCPVGATGVNVQAVAQALADCFLTTAAQTALKAAALRNAGERVLHSRPLQPSASYAKELREARDVFLCCVEFELLMQGDRSAN